MMDGSQSSSLASREVLFHSQIANVNDITSDLLVEDAHAVWTLRLKGKIRSAHDDATELSRTYPPPV